MHPIIQAHIQAHKFMEPKLVEKFADNGDHSHWELINPDTNEIIWSEESDVSKDEMTGKLTYQLSLLINTSAEVQTFIEKYKAKLRRTTKHFDIAEKIEYVPGEYIWHLDTSMVNWHFELKEDEFYFHSRAKFNDDGTDNRQELTPESQLKMEQSTIKAIAFGVRPDAGFSSDWVKNEEWWCCVDHYRTKWIRGVTMGATKEEVFKYWSAEYVKLRDKWFDNRRADLNREKQRRIDEAKRVLQEAQGGAPESFNQQ